MNEQEKAEFASLLAAKEDAYRTINRQQRIIEGLQSDVQILERRLAQAASTWRYGEK